MPPKIKTPFQEIISSYDAFFIDIWGVVHDGKTPYPGVVNALNNLISTKQVIFLSNAPKPASKVLKMLQGYGINVQIDGILTSGDVVRTEISNDLSKKIYHIGEGNAHGLLEGIPARLVTDVKEADLILLSDGLEEGEPDDKFDAILLEAAGLKLPLICANPDTYVPNGDYIYRCSGVIAARYKGMENSGGITYYGKPHLPIFEAALGRASVEKQGILMIGDTLDTDIFGARNFEIDSALTLTGNGAEWCNKLDVLGVHDNAPTWVIDGWL